MSRRIPRNSRTSRSTLVLDGLRDDIIRGRFAPGQRVTEASIAERFGVSRIPVREALRGLQSEGLVRLERDVGARVSPLDPAELREVYLMREGIEPLVVAEATRRASLEDIQELRRLVGKSEQFAAKHDLRGYMRIDESLHTHIYTVSRLARAIGVIEQLWQTTRRYREIYALLPHSIETSVQEHRLLLDAIVRGAAADAADIHRVHIRRTRVTLIESDLLGESEVKS